MQKDICRYEIIKSLGSGAFGHVYLAFDNQKKEKVAIKRSLKCGKELSREYEILSELSSSRHCVALRDCFFTRKGKQELIQNFVFEFMEDDLQAVINKHRDKGLRISEKLVLIYAYQIFKSLKELQDKKIVHRDLKPENILRNSNHVVKLSDFGSAKVLDPGLLNSPYVVARYYRAPELFMAITDYDYEIDIWAAGCVIAELVMLRPIFCGASDGQQFFSIEEILGSFTEEDKTFYKEKSYDIHSCMNFLPVVPRNESRLNELYNQFSNLLAAQDFFGKVFKLNPKQRITASEALNHEIFSETRYLYDKCIKPHGE
jgi:serine/threonine protein kinase